MEGFLGEFKNKKITLLGLGLLGRGVGDAEFLAKCGANVTVTDKKTETELAPSIARLRKYPNVAFHLGGHRTPDFTTADLVVKAAGVPLDSKEVAAARGAGVPVAMSTALFAKYAAGAGTHIVGVTGTRGKSTVAHMIHSVLIRENKKTVLGGNIRGLSTLAMLPNVARGDIAVLELDSWQLQGFGDLSLSPDIAIFTNLMPDHQNYYKDMEEYFNDKANIFRYQKQGDALLVGSSIAEKVRAERPLVPPVVPPPVPAEWALKVPGEHNRENASFAVAALRILGLSEQEIRAGIESFEAVEGRLQFVREINGVKIYNDNNATTPEATIAALRAIGSDITLICGGSEKGLPLERLVSEIKKRVSRVLLLVHPNYKGSTRLAQELDKAGISYEACGDLKDAVKKAAQVAKKGAILFSPAFASFGMFNNEYERNDQFLALVGKLSDR